MWTLVLLFVATPADLGGSPDLFTTMETLTRTTFYTEEQCTKAQEAAIARFTAEKIEYTLVQECTKVE